jgi:2-polyprenyl-3-methyl-5-hydroxy-6-metoxy-1,4-benzoquinol methylase
MPSQLREQQLDQNDRSTIVRARRVEAAVASGGTSGAAIHRAVLSIASIVGLRGDVLEFGAGTATLVKQLICGTTFQGSVTGADILPRPACLDPKIRWIQTDLNDPLPVPSQSFDAIVSTEVIEHLENPRAVFREFHRLLRPAGTLLVSTPNQESLRSLASFALRGHFVDFLDSSYPAHITALVRKDFERICLETGFEPPKFVYTNHGGIPKFPRLAWQTLSFGGLKGRLFSDNVVVMTQAV